MDVVHRRAIAAGGLITERRLIKHSPGAQIAVVVGLGFDADSAHGGFESELAEHDRSNAGDLNAGANLAQHFCLLENKHVDPLMTQPNSSGPPANATTSTERTHPSATPLDN